MAAALPVLHIPATEERWIRVIYPEYPQYEVSSNGRLRNTQTGKIMSKTLNSDYQYYYTMSPQKGIHGKNRMVRVSRIVWESFHKKLLPKGAVIEYKNGDVADNRLSNLKVDPKYFQDDAPPAAFPPILVKLADTPPAPPATDPKTLAAAEKWQRHIDDLRNEVRSSNTLDELIAIGIRDSEWLDMLEGLSDEETGKLIRLMYQALRKG